MYESSLIDIQLLNLKYRFSQNIDNQAITIRTSYI
jgi:hypothetical protein